MKFTRKERIINAVLLNASFIENIGLMHGKMGISIFFFHLARQTGNKIYQDYAEELINEIYEEISSSTPFNFENGLAGIGWGIECLVQNGFIEADTDEVLEEFDNKLFHQLIYNTPAEMGLLNGLLGIGFYLLMRVENPSSNDENIQTLTNKQSLIYLVDELDRRLTPDKIQELLNGPSVKLKSDLNEAEAPFDITWDYTLLLWFLTEMHQQNIFNFKVEQVLIRLIEPLINEKNWPQKHSNRLLVILALENLNATTTKKWLQEISTAARDNMSSFNKKEKELNKKESIGLKLDKEELTKKLSLPNIKRETIIVELQKNKTSFNHATSCVTLIYQYLYQLTGEEDYLSEAQFWRNKDFVEDFKGNDLDEIPPKSEKNALGLLEGLAGIGLLNYVLLPVETRTI